MDFKIVNLKTYPEDGNHQEVVFDLPYSITKGRDRFFYTDEHGNERHNEPDKWICFINNSYANCWCVAEVSLVIFDKFEVKQFDTAKEAVEYCVSHYKEWLKKRCEQLNEPVKSETNTANKIVVQLLSSLKWAIDELELYKPLSKSTGRQFDSYPDKRKKCEEAIKDDTMLAPKQVEHIFEGQKYVLSNENLVVGDKVFPISWGVNDSARWTYQHHYFDFSFPYEPHTILDLKHSKDSKAYEVRTDHGYSPVECYYKIISKEKI